MKLGSLVVEIAADSTKLNTGIDASEKKLDSLSKKATTAVSSFAKYSAAASLAGAGITAALVAKASAAIDAQAKLAQQLNTTSESMATLDRAGQLSGISMEKIATAGRTLSVRMGEASAGMGPAAESLERLGLSAEYLSSIPLDQRINAINNAIRQNIPASEQAAVAADFFGERMGTALLTMSGDTIDEARRQVELFGLALSDVDAAKVEMANDAFSTFNMATDGMIQQLTVELAPILKAIGDEFLNAADEAGGFGNIAIDALDKVVSGAAFVADAADGVKRTFELTADGILIAINTAMAEVARVVADVLDTVDNLPGVDFSETVNSINEFASAAEGVVDEAWKNVDETLSRPFAGESLRQFVEDAKTAGQAAAEAVVAGRTGATVDGGGEGAPDAAAIKEQEALNAKIEAIRQANATEMELLMQKQAAEMEALQAFYAGKDELWQEFAELELETISRHEEEKTEIERRAAEARKQQADEEARYKQQAMMKALSNLTTLMNSSNREMFEIGKVAALSQAAIDGYAAITGAYKVGAGIGGPALGAAYGAAAALATANQINSIRSQTFGGGGGGAVGGGSVTGSINAQSEPVRTQSAQPSQTMMVSGISEGELFTGDRVRSIVGELLEYQRNGGTVILE